MSEIYFIVIGVMLSFPYLCELYLSFLVFFWKSPNLSSVRTVNEEPFVSILVPAYREPPEVLIDTLRSLKDQSYSNYEVLVLINNTPEPDLWIPVKIYCERVGKPFKFLYLKQVDGFKAGVLNEAEKYLNPKTEIIGVVDSDYIVDRNFIKNAIYYFSSSDVGIVQFPQDYRNLTKDLFSQAMYYSYRYFFATVMKYCDLLRATSFMGTVGFIKRSALMDVGSWDGRVLTEDSEIGLRINAKGYKCIYIDQSVGKGLMPLDFKSCKIQRYRWSYGNMQTILKHLKLLLFDRKFPIKKKIAFITQNIVWHNPLLIVIILGYFSLLIPKFGLLSLTIGSLYLFSKTLIFLLIFKKVDNLSFFKAFLSYLFYLSLFVPMSIAPIKALLGIKMSFKRTPKSHNFLLNSTNLEELILGSFIFLLIILSLKKECFYSLLTGLISSVYFLSYIGLQILSILDYIKNLRISQKNRGSGYENWDNIATLEKSTT
ncbi:MAG: glycosyltransferase [Candidatus Omnitrophica bacterium]|nr:glycosyltransferase [Candidatus Omnitrophota bacterium]